MKGNNEEKGARKMIRRITHFITWLTGSWWGVIFHTLWFGCWLYFDFDLNLLTLAVSLEAIFIGIFVLIASNESEAARDRREAAAQRRSQDIIDNILDMETKIEKQQQQIIKLLAENNHPEIKEKKSSPS